MNLSRTIAASLSSTTTNATKTLLLRSLLLQQSSIHSTPLAAAAAATKAFSWSKRPSSQIPIPESPPPLPPPVLSSSPRPSEVPWQPKVANSVKVVGYIATPVRLDISPNGIYRASSVLNHEKKGELPQFRIPIIFEGDLAQVAACHLKENDLVHVTGQLSGGSHLLNIQNEQTRLQVMVQSLNFVEEIYPKKKMQAPNSHNEHASVVSGNKKKASKSDKSHWEDLIANPGKWWDHRKQKLDGLINPKFPDFKHKDTELALWIGSAPDWVPAAIEGLQFDVKKRKNGSFSAKISGLGTRQTSGCSSFKAPVNPSSKVSVELIDALWKDLVENPSKWWDNRVNKRYPKSPDFKHKDTGEALWISNKIPVWALPKLPPLKNQLGVVKLDDQ